MVDLMEAKDKIAELKGIPKQDELLNILKTGGDCFDAAWVDQANFFYGFIQRGEAFISNQRGIHGDLPATSHRDKIVLAICFDKLISFVSST